MNAITDLFANVFPLDSVVSVSEINKKLRIHSERVLCLNETLLSRTLKTLSVIIAPHSDPS